MPRNGSGGYSLPQASFVAGTVISSAAVNSDFNDIASALTGSLPRDGQAGMTGQLKAADGSTVAPSISFSNEPNTGFSRIGAGVVAVSILGVQVGTITASGISGVAPVGSVIDYAGLTVPPLWLACYGQAVSRTTYSALFTALGTLYGAGDGFTTFNLPDLRGRTTAGADGMGGTLAGVLTTAYFGSNTNDIGNYGGFQNERITIANLPPYTPVGTISGTASVSPVGRTNVVGTNGTVGGVQTLGGSQQASPATTAGGTGDYANVTTFTGAITASFVGTSAGWGSGGVAVPLTTIQPTMITFKIIYAGA
jgi:microcystin-dependent protein